MAPDSLRSFERSGAAHLPGVAAPFLNELEMLLGGVSAGHAGVRLNGMGGLGAVLGAEQLGGIAAQHLGPDARPVRATLFDKNEAINWGLGWHQDRTIAVRRRTNVAGFGPWSRKSGMVHVEPPFSLIASMLTLRIHLDDVDEANAPLLVAPGSHLLGRLPAAQIAGAVARCGILTCLAQTGDVWFYRTAILHASAPAARPRRRRVLQVDYSAKTLPSPLEWLGVG